MISETVQLCYCTTPLKLMRGTEYTLTDRVQQSQDCSPLESRLTLMRLAWMSLCSSSLSYTVIGLLKGQIAQAIQSERPCSKSKQAVMYNMRNYVFTGSIKICISSFPRLPYGHLEVPPPDLFRVKYLT